ncbi:Conidiation-specific protein (Con-10) [Penicillium angulare]|uniref:Conidiation-specific protein (Con-10) n=1 Tax=Penicillium angulare TaxID=116970 RepID=A0A9W9FYK1_9EURO|nr:Conidiation-specific protein (Con-10) [Penicillium angulare]
MASNPNPGNFANRPHGEVEEIARKGGQTSHSHSGGFASMEPMKQVSEAQPIFIVCFDIDSMLRAQREIASQGGRRSSGSFKPGDPRAKEAGHKGGKARHEHPEE